jgi:hypothetical protein
MRFNLRGGIVVNHVRTIVLNLQALQPSESADFEEFIPAGYTVRRYTGSMLGVQEALVPSTTSRTNKNTQLAALMQLAHSPDVVGYTLAPDPRYTYRLNESDVVQARILGSLSRSSDIHRLHGRLQAIVGASNGHALFSLTGVPSYMEELRELWVSGQDTGIKVVAAMLAFTLQSDRIYNAS